MKEEEKQQRAAVVAEAHEWLGTKYHPNARLKGIGCDCLTILAGVFENCGLVLNAEIPHYSPEFMLHQSEEKYIEGLKRYTREVDTPQPGDIAVWKFGRCFSHAAVVIEWPRVIHAYVGSTVTLEDISKAEWLRMMGAAPRPVRFFSYWGR